MALFKWRRRRRMRKVAQKDSAAACNMTTGASDAPNTNDVRPEEALPLLQACVRHIKLRGLAVPLIFLPFRPGSMSSSVDALVNTYFNTKGRNRDIEHDLAITDPLVLLGAIRWICSRLRDGVITDAEYILFVKTENDLGFPTDAFTKIINILFDSPARKWIFLTMMDLLTSIGAHDEVTGHTIDRLATMSSILLFRPSRSDTNGTFEEGYKFWLRSSQATLHFLYAYVRDAVSQNLSGLTKIPLRLERRISKTTYPPKFEATTASCHEAIRLNISVIRLSETPMGLVSSAVHLLGQDENYMLQQFAEGSLNELLDDECFRVLQAIGNVASGQSERLARDQSDAEWIDFQDNGFSESKVITTQIVSQRSETKSRERLQLRTKLPRPKTIDWGKFLLSGFSGPFPASNLLPVEYCLPTIGIDEASMKKRSDVSNGTITRIKTMQLDDSFWDAWLMSLAGESTADLKQVFGLSVVLRLRSSSQWIVLSEVLHQSEAQTQYVSGTLCEPRKSRQVIAPIAGQKSNSSITEGPFSTCKAAEQRARALVLSKTAREYGAMSQARTTKLKQERELKSDTIYVIDTPEDLDVMDAYIHAYDTRKFGLLLSQMCETLESEENDGQERVSMSRRHSAEDDSAEGDSASQPVNSLSSAVSCPAHSTKIDDPPEHTAIEESCSPPTSALLDTRDRHLMDTAATIMNANNVSAFCSTSVTTGVSEVAPPVEPILSAGKIRHPHELAIDAPRSEPRIQSATLPILVPESDTSAGSQKTKYLKRVLPWEAGSSDTFVSATSEATIHEAVSKFKEESLAHEAIADRPTTATVLPSPKAAPFGATASTRSSVSDCSVIGSHRDRYCSVNSSQMSLSGLSNSRDSLTRPSLFVEHCSAGVSGIDPSTQEELPKIVSRQVCESDSTSTRSGDHGASSGRNRWREIKEMAKAKRFVRGKVFAELQDNLQA